VQAPHPSEVGQPRLTQSTYNSLYSEDSKIEAEGCRDLAQGKWDHLTSLNLCKTTDI
jgi:hypothetical protein